MAKKVITVDDILQASQSDNKTLACKQEECLVTPGAWDKMEELGVTFANSNSSCTASREPLPMVAPPPSPASAACPSDVQRVTDQVSSLLSQKLPKNSDVDLEYIVRKVVQDKLTATLSGSSLGGGSSAGTANKVKLIKGDTVLAESGGLDLPGKVVISDAVPLHQEVPQTVTYMQWNNSSLNHEVSVPEIVLVVEGTVELTVEMAKMKACSGDIFYLQEGASVVYRADGNVKLACINL